MICMEDVFLYLPYIRHRNVRNELRTLDADRSSGEFKYTLVFLLPALALDRCALSWYFNVQSAFLRSSSQQRPIPGNWAVLLLKPSVEIRKVAERLAWSIMCKRSTSLVVFIAFLLHFQKCDFLQLRLFSAVCGNYTIMVPSQSPAIPVLVRVGFRIWTARGRDVKDLEPAPWVFLIETKYIGWFFSQLAIAFWGKWEMDIFNLLFSKKIDMTTWNGWGTFYTNQRISFLWCPVEMTLTKMLIS